MTSEDRPGEGEPQFVALVAIDWADQKHVWALEATGSGKREQGELAHSPEAIEKWVGELAARFGNRPIGRGSGAIPRWVTVHAPQV